MSGSSPRRSPRGTPRVPRKPPATGLEERDPLGRMALFSDPEPESDPPATEFLLLECSSCLTETPVSPLGVVRAALPFSLHLPLVRRYHSLMRCPACGRRAWVRLRVRP